MTKFYGIPGLRLGFLISHKKTIARINKHKEPWSVNVLAQRVGEVCLKDHQFSALTRDFVVRERNYLYTQMKGIKGLRAFDSSANYLLVKVEKNGLSSTEIYRSLARDGLLIRDCRSFRGMGTRFIRVAVKKRKQNQLLLKALRKIVER
jgi:threonine-phosphate decarboxylase